ncbi:hypothetical protein HCN44_003473 [Aphidius gifuensis]|uniref:Uncharacterized protein n=1 Tax=Aphidius gifuensis TaxID=684658 RepID=A0A834XLL0_APHGI|nr:hypothetical protein HCN44_003473 [Aphidius gifuensis]
MSTLLNTGSTDKIDTTPSSPIGSDRSTASSKRGRGDDEDEYDNILKKPKAVKNNIASVMSVLAKMNKRFDDIEAQVSPINDISGKLDKIDSLFQSLKEITDRLDATTASLCADNVETKSNLETLKARVDALALEPGDAHGNNNTVNILMHAANSNNTYIEKLIQKSTGSTEFVLSGFPNGPHLDEPLKLVTEYLKSFCISYIFSKLFLI